MKKKITLIGAGQIGGNLANLIDIKYFPLFSLNDKIPTLFKPCLIIK